MATSRTKILLGNLFLLAVSVAVSLLLLEQGYRFFLFGWSSLSVPQMNSLHGIGVSGVLQPSAHKDIIYEHKPDVRTRFKLTPFATNSRGLRDHEYDLAKPANTFRIAVVGDSFTLPSGVAIEDAFHTRLEERLNRESAGDRYEVLNFAVSGYNLRQYVGVVENKCSLYDPALILIGYCAQNDHKPQRWKFEREYVTKKVEYSFFRSFALQGLRSSSGFGVKKRRTDAAIVLKLKKKKHRRYLAEYLERLRDYSQARAVPVFVVQLDIRWYEVPFLEQKLRELGFSYLNATLPFRDREFGDYILNPLDFHPNSAAHEIFASEIHDFLDSAGGRDLRLPPRPPARALDR